MNTDSSFYVQLHSSNMLAHPANPQRQESENPHPDANPSNDVFFYLTHNPGFVPVSELQKKQFRQLSKRAYNHFYDGSFQTNITLNFEDSIKKIHNNLKKDPLEGGVPWKKCDIIPASGNEIKNETLRDVVQKKEWCSWKELEYMGLGSIKNGDYVVAPGVFWNKVNIIPASGNEIKNETLLDLVQKKEWWSWKELEDMGIRGLGLIKNGDYVLHSFQRGSEVSTTVYQAAFGSRSWISNQETHKQYRLLISVKTVSRRDFMLDLPHYQKINHLKFWCCTFGDYRVEDIALALPNLIKFEIHYCYSGIVKKDKRQERRRNAAALQADRSLGPHQNLKTINICHCFYIGRYRPKIFPLFGTDDISTYPYLDFNFKGFSTRFPSLTHLNLSHNNFDGEKISTIQSELKSLALLNSLDMTNSDLTIKETASVLGFSTPQSVIITSLEHLSIDMQKQKITSSSSSLQEEEEERIATYFSSGLKQMTKLKSLAIPLVALPYGCFINSLSSLASLRFLEKLDVSSRSEWHRKSFSAQDDAHETIMKAFGRCTKLTDLVLNASNLHGWMYNVTQQYNDTLFQNLRRIYLDNCFYKLPGTINRDNYGISNIITKLSHYNKLEKISMSSNDMNIKNLEQISLHFSCENLPNLTELDLSNNFFGDDLLDPTRIDFSKFTKLIALDIEESFNVIHLEKLEIILPPNINKFNMSKIVHPFFDVPRNSGKMIRFLKKIQEIQQLKVLNFEETGIGKIKCESPSLLKRWFEIFRDGSRNYNPDLVGSFSEMIYSLKNISHLNLAKNCLTTANLHELSKGIQECRYLENLNLAQNFIGRHNFAGWWGSNHHPVSAIVKACRSLVVLNLENNLIDFVDIQQMFLDLNPTHPSLYELNLSENAITYIGKGFAKIYAPPYEERMQILLSFLALFKELQVLKMENTGLSEQTFQPLIHHLKNMSPLHTLRLKLDSERSPFARHIREQFQNEYGYLWDQLVMEGGDKINKIRDR